MRFAFFATILSAAVFATGGCQVAGCSEYASDYSCSFVENNAEYEVWYWKNVENDDPADEVLIGRAVGLAMCQDNARAFAAAIGEPFSYRAHICVLMDDGRRMEKHRLL
jgi:hypothetical protein